MSAIRFGYLGAGIVLFAGAGAIAACSSNGSTPDDGSGAGAGGFTAGGFPNGGSGLGGTNPQGGTGQGGTIAQGGTGQGGTIAQGGSGQGGAGQGGVAVGGATSSTDIKITGSATLCPGATPTIPATQITACSISSACTGAHCVPSAQIPAGTDPSLLAKCPDGSYCTPDDYIATQGKFLVKKCMSLEGAEGRCISKCVPQVSVQLATLPKDVCADNELCAPCWNPIDGTDTKACGQGCDTGPPATKVTFDPCGGTQGVCVPPSLVTDPVQLSALKAIDDPTAACTKTDSSGAKYLCAPKAKAADQSKPFPTCMGTSAAYLTGLANMAGQKGGCVPKYLIPSGKQALVAPGPGAPANDGCMDGELCAPCTDFTAGNAPTGACPWP